MPGAYGAPVVAINVTIYGLSVAQLGYVKHGARAVAQKALDMMEYKKY